MASLRGTTSQTIFVKDKEEAKKIYRNIIKPTHNEKRKTVNKIKSAFSRISR